MLMKGQHGLLLLKQTLITHGVYLVELAWRIADALYKYEENK